ncbi:hypothetical protein BH23ACT10_BH23ACT10_24970 [soil metagenome]
MGVCAVPQDRDDDAYFEPLADMRLDAATELHLSLVPYHPNDHAPA